MGIGPYKTLKTLSRSGMAELYLARKGDDGDVVVLKALRPPATAKRVAMFLDEVRLGPLLDHPNIVRTYAIEYVEDRPFIVMEYLDGKPLDQILELLPVETPDADRRAVRLFILSEALAGLHWAHELSVDGKPLDVVHRDFNPQNIFVTYDGRVKLLDFGIAKTAGRVAQDTTTGEVKGKVGYMAPEQALALRGDRRADIFAAGILLYELCTGTSFWEGASSVIDVFDCLVAGAYPLEVPGETPGINAILPKALAREVQARYRTAGEMRDDLVAEIERFASLDSLRTRTRSLVSSLAK